MRRPSPALIVAVIALIVALSGTAVADTVVTAAKKLVTSRDIRDGTIATKDLSPRARAQLRGATVPGDCFLTITRSGTYLITGSVTWAFNTSGMRLIDINGWTVNLAAPQTTQSA